MILRNEIVFILALKVTTFLKVDALKCWSCSTQGLNGSLCSDPFDPDIIPNFQSRENYVDCYIPGLDQSSTIRTACKKVELEIYGTILTQRTCSYEDINDPPDKCFNDDVPAYFKTVFCEKCLTDGCNNASNLIPKFIFILTSTGFLTLIFFLM